LIVQHPLLVSRVTTSAICKQWAPQETVAID